MKTWLKGGLWGILICIIIVMMAYITFTLGLNAIDNFVITATSPLLNLLMVIIGKDISIDESKWVIVAIINVISFLIEGFILGSLIGFIVQKVKRRK